MQQQGHPITNPDGRKLYRLTVADAERARLLEIVNDPSFTEFQDEDHGFEALRLGFWLVAAPVLFGLFMLGLLFGGGR